MTATGQSCYVGGHTFQALTVRHGVHLKYALSISLAPFCVYPGIKEKHINIRARGVNLAREMLGLFGLVSPHGMEDKRLSLMCGGIFQFL